MSEEGVPLFKGHMNRDDVQHVVNVLIAQRREIDVQCFMMLNEIKDYLVDERFTEATELCRKRIEVADTVMKVISGDEKFMKFTGL